LATEYRLIKPLTLFVHPVQRSPLRFKVSPWEQSRRGFCAFHLYLEDESSPSPPAPCSAGGVPLNSQCHTLPFGRRPATKDRFLCPQALKSLEKVNTFFLLSYELLGFWRLLFPSPQLLSFIGQTCSFLVQCRFSLFSMQGPRLSSFPQALCSRFSCTLPTLAFAFPHTTLTHIPLSLTDLDSPSVAFDLASLFVFVNQKFFFFFFFLLNKPHALS